MANRCAPVTQIENLSGALSAATYFDGNWQGPVTALNESSLGYNNAIASDSGSANNYVVASVFGTATAYNPGMWISFIPANTNTGASTITVDSLTSAAIVDYAGNPLNPGAIQAGKLTVICFISGSFRLLYTAIPQLFFFNNVPTVTGTIAINCQGSFWVSIMIDANSAPASGTYTLALSNLAPGCHIKAYINTRGISQIWKWSGTDVFANTVSLITVGYPNSNGVNSPLAATTTNLINTGDQAAGFLFYEGAHMYETGGQALKQIRFISIFN